MVTREKECENGGQTGTVRRDDKTKSRLILGRRKQSDLLHPQTGLGIYLAQK
jgi:hypothetical protein